MTISNCDLSGTPVQKGRVVMPALGIFHADVVLVDQTQPTGSQTLTLMGMVMTMAVVRAISFVGARGVCLVGGAAGWRQVVAAQQFSNPGGLMASTVINPTAALVGESVSIATDFQIGLGYARSNDKASCVLDDILGSVWWMSIAGIIQTSPRPATTIASQFTIQSSSGASGVYKVATETPGDWLPGANFALNGVSGQVSRVTHHIEPTNIVAEVMVA